MHIKKEYIDMTIDFLELIHENLQPKECLIEEIKLIKKHIDAYGDKGFDISYSTEYRGIEDLIVTEQTKLCMKETDLDVILGKERTLEVYLSKLDKELSEVVKIRYISDVEKLVTFEDIAKKIKFSEATARRRHNAAVEKIAYFKYGSKAVDNDENVSEKCKKNDGTMYGKVC